VELATGVTFDDDYNGEIQSDQRINIHHSPQTMRTHNDRSSTSAAALNVLCTAECSSTNMCFSAVYVVYGISMSDYDLT
jgi:hypothetical protein